MRSCEPDARALVGINGPTIFTGNGARDVIARGLPYGPGGGVLRGIHVSIAQGGPMGNAS